MNIWDELKFFEKYENALGSKFAAIVYVSKLIRKKREEVGCCITESEALAWLITGVEPNKVKRWRNGELRRERRAATYAKDRLLYVDDKEVRSAVEKTLLESSKVEHLIYFYNNLQDESRKARVRILSNIIWDEMKLIDIDDRKLF